MGTFVRCRGKAYCQEDAQGCRLCGRSSMEIAATRALIDSAARFILEQDYDNAAEFAAYLAEKIEKKVRYERQQRLGEEAD